MALASRIRTLGLVFVCSLLLACLAGCGGERDQPPKTAAELTEQEKQQIQELQEQRASEWGTTKKK